MHFTRRGRTLVLALAFPAIATATVDCTLLNPLDHLQAGRDRPSASDDGSVASSDAAADGATPDGPDNAPGCGPAHWSECHVQSIGSLKQPIGVVFGPSSVFVTDEAAGEILELHCSSAGCSPPTTLLSGEDGPRELAAHSDSIYWTTHTSIRRFQIITQPDAAPTLETLDAVQGVASIAAEYPLTVWADDKGLRAYPMNQSVITMWTSPAAHVAQWRGEIFFVSQGEVKQCAWDIAGGAKCAPPGNPLPGSAGAETLAWSGVFTEPPLGPLRGLIGALPSGAGSHLALLDKLDDAGVPMPLADDPAKVRSIAGSTTQIYWTNAAGELRRRAKDAPAITTLLHGLGTDTEIAVSDTLVMIVDRTERRVLSYAP